MEFLVRTPQSLIQMLLVFMFMVHVINSQCVMERVEDKKGKDSSINVFLSGSTEDACNTLCLAEAECLFTKLQSGLCYYWKSTSDILDESGEYLYSKTCNSDTTVTDAPTTTTTTTTAPPPTTAPPTTTTPPTTTLPPTTAATCSMTITADTDASNHDLELSDMSLSTCEQACQAIQDCHHFVFIQSSSSCKLYSMENNDKTPQNGATLGQRKSCDNGTYCCFEITDDYISTHTPAVTLTMSQASCENLCLTVEKCTASSYTGTSCKLFTSTPIVSASTGVTLSTKDCSGGAASTGTLALSEMCTSSASSTASLTTHLFLVIGVKLLYSLLQ